MIFQSDADIPKALERWNGEQILGPFYQAALTHFAAQRREFRNGVFMRSGGQLETICKSGADLTLSDTGPVDAVGGNHYLHWPLREEIARRIAAGEKPDRAEENAFIRVLAPVREILKPRGVAVFLTGKDFVSVDDDPQVNDDLERATLVAHPIYELLQDFMNGLLRDEYGIARETPRTTPLFRTSTIRARFAAAGFELERISFFENTTTASPLDTFVVRMPLWLGSVTELTVAQKLAAIASVRDLVLAYPEPNLYDTPARGEYFTFVARKID